MALGDDVEGVEIILILAAIGAIGYGIYYVINNGFPGLAGAGTPDPGGGAPATGVLSALENQTLEIGSSSESFSDAQSEVFSDPIGSLKTIVSGWFGGN